MPWYLNKFSFYFSSVKQSKNKKQLELITNKKTNKDGRHKEAKLDLKAAIFICFLFDCEAISIWNKKNKKKEKKKKRKNRKKKNKKNKKKETRTNKKNRNRKKKKKRRRRRRSQRRQNEEQKHEQEEQEEQEDENTKFGLFFVY